MQNTSEKSTPNEDQAQPTVTLSGVTSKGQIAPTMLPNIVGMGESMVPLIPFAMNYHPNMPLPFNYTTARPIPCRLPAQYSTFQIPIVSTNQKRPVLGSSQYSQNFSSPAMNVLLNHGVQNGLTKDNSARRKPSQETTMSESDSLKNVDAESSEPSYKTQCLMSETKNCWSSRAEPSMPKPFTLLQPQPLMTPNYLIPLPIMCPNPVKLASSQYHIIQNSLRNSEDTLIPDRRDDSTVNPRPGNSMKEPDAYKEASALKTQIIKNVEELFDMATKNASPKSDQVQSSEIDERNLHDTCRPFDETLDGDASLMETVLKCCIEVEAYWTEAARDSNTRALILGCCKSIRRLISSDFRQSEANMISSLQELTLSLILLFLISSLS